MIDDDRMVLWVERTRVTLDALAECYLELEVLVGGRQGGDVGGGSHVSARPPLDLHVVDLRAAVEGLVGRFVPLVRGALRMGLSAGPAPAPKAGERPKVEMPPPPAAPAAALGWLRDALAGVAGEDPDLARELGAAAWGLRGPVERACGRQPRPYRIGEPCPSSGALTLFVDPHRGVVRCVDVDCGAEWPVEYPILAWSSESGTTARDAYRAAALAVQA